MGRNRLSQLPVILIVFIGLLFFVHFAISKKIALVSVTEDRILITDFSYFLKTVEHYWFTDNKRIYNLDTQKLIQSNLVGKDVSPGMLPHFTPIAVGLWLPFSWLSRIDLKLANSLWLALSLTLLVLGCHRIVSLQSRAGHPAALSLALIFVAILFSSSMLTALIQAQTVIFASGLILLLIAKLSTKDSSSQGILQLTLISFLLAIKPQYYLFGLVLLVLYRQIRPAAYSMLLCITACLVLTPWLGILWPLEYLNILSVHTASETPALFRSSLDLESMITFKSAFKAVLNARFLTLVSFMFLVSGCLVPLVVGLSRLSKGTGFFQAEFITRSQLLLLMFGAYLLFSPEFYTYEEIILVVIFSVMGISPNRIFGINLVSLGLILATLLLANQYPLMQTHPIWLLWSAKLLFITLAISLVKKQTGSPLA